MWLLFFVIATSITPTLSAPTTTSSTKAISSLTPTPHSPLIEKLNNLNKDHSHFVRSFFEVMKWNLETNNKVVQSNLKSSFEALERTLEAVLREQRDLKQDHENGLKSIAMNFSAVQASQDQLKNDQSNVKMELKTEIAALSTQIQELRDLIASHWSSSTPNQHTTNTTPNQHTTTTPNQHTTTTPNQHTNTTPNQHTTTATPNQHTTTTPNQHTNTTPNQHTTTATPNQHTTATPNQHTTTTPNQHTNTTPNQHTTTTHNQYTTTTTPDPYTTPISTTPLISRTPSQDASGPVVIAQPPKVEVSEGDGTSFFCEATKWTGSEAPKLSWKNPRNELVTDTSTGSRVSNQVRGRKLLLIITKTAKEDAGTWTCALTMSSGDVKTSTVVLETWQNIKFISPQKLQEPVIGTDALIKCEVTSKPAAKVTWTKDGGPDLKNGDKYKLVKNGLIIKKITEADSGKYSCNAMIEAKHQFDSLEIQVRVTIPPRMANPPSSVGDAILGKDVKIICQATGKPKPRYSWLKITGNNVTEVTRDPRINVNREDGSLEIKKLEMSDGGDYVCKAMNTGGVVSSSYKLVVLDAGCQNGWIGFNNSCYKFIDESLTWNKARIACMLMRADLPIVRSKQHNDFLMKGIKKDKSLWIGLRGDWYKFKWLDGTEVRKGPYSNFARGQPSLIDGCVHISNGGNSHTFWFDDRCDVVYSNSMYACEQSKNIAV